MNINKLFNKLKYLWILFPIIIIIFLFQLIGIILIFDVDNKINYPAIFAFIAFYFSISSLTFNFANSKEFLKIETRKKFFSILKYNLFSILIFFLSILIVEINQKLNYYLLTQIFAIMFDLSIFILTCVMLYLIYLTLKLILGEE